MKVELENTDKIVTLERDGSTVQARVWQGHTDSGIPVQAFVAMIVPEVPTSDPLINQKTAQFEQELQRLVDPRPTVQAIPLHLIL